VAAGLMRRLAGRWWAVTCLLVGGTVAAGLAAPVAWADTAPSNVSPPSVSGLAVQGQTLTAASGTWAGTTPLSFAYQWQRCNQSGAGCSAITAATGQAYTVAAADVGSTLRVQVSASNTAGSAQTLSDATAVVVAAAAPANTSAPELSGVAQLGQTLTVSTGAWSGQPPPSYAYQWQRCDAAGANCANISAATDKIYVIVAADVGNRLQALVTATNSSGSATKASGQSATVSSPPTATAAPTVSGSPTVGQTLTAGNGSWSGVPAPTLAVQWQRCDSVGNNCADIAGAGGPSYALTAADVNHRLRIVVTASNSAGSTSASSSPTATVATAAAPTNSVHPTISGTPVVGQTLTAAPGSWAGAAPISFAYQWQLCSAAGTQCANVAGATGQSLVLDANDFNHRVQVLVTATNLAGSGSRVSGQSAPIQSAPVNAIQPSIVGTPRAGQTLSISAGSWIGTTPISYSYQWQRCAGNGGNCQTISGAFSRSYTAAAADVGNVIQALVTAQNRLGAATKSTLPTAPIAASPARPALTAPPTIVGQPQVGNLLYVTTTAVGFPPPALSFQWQRCTSTATACLNIPGATTSRYRIRSGDAGHRLRALVTAANNSGQAVLITQPTATVRAALLTRLVLATRALRLKPGRIRLTVSEVRGFVKVNLWLELDAWRQRRWQRVTSNLIGFGARTTIKLISFQVRPNRDHATVSIRWRASTNNKIYTSTYSATTNSLRPVNPRG
jgi:fibronectin-binding autotransporter adhesin